MKDGESTACSTFFILLVVGWAWLECLTSDLVEGRGWPCSAFRFLAAAGFSWTVFGFCSPEVVVDFPAVVGFRAVSVEEPLAEILLVFIRRSYRLALSSLSMYNIWVP